MFEVQGRTPCQEQPRLFAAPDGAPLWGGMERRETVSERRKRERAAVQLCWGCSVWRECREWAVRSDEQTATVCGGLTPTELKEERRARRVVVA